MLCCVQAIHQTVQKTLKQLRTDCSLIEARIEQQMAQDSVNRQLNHSRTVNAMAFIAATVLVLLLLAGALASRTAAVVCPPADGSEGIMCSGSLMQSLLEWHDTLEGVFTSVVGGLLLLLLVCGGGAGFSWRGAPVLDKRQHKRLEEHRAAVHRAKQDAEAMWEDYFASISHAGDR